MVRQIYWLSLIILLLTLSACGGVAAQSVPPSDSALAGDAFVEALHRRIGQDKIVPEFGRLEIPPLVVNEKTFAFPEKQGTVLQLNIFGYPDPKGTQNLVAPLIEAAVSVAGGHEVSLDGIEVIFHRRDEFNPMQIRAATPPWGPEQIFFVPQTGN